MTYVDCDSGLVEDEHRREIPRDEAIELVAVLVELDRVQRLTVQVVMAFEERVRVAYSVVWDAHFSQSKAVGDGDDGWSE